jgi:peptidoglycan hydrolase-like protein with peptidoglycan-binding domain
MNTFAIIQMVVQWIGPVREAIDLAESNTDLVSKIKSLSAPLAQLLEGVGSELFPKAAPGLHIVGGVLAAFNPNYAKWLQGALNSTQNLNPPLVVDGVYGPRTRAAVEQVQAKLGLRVDGLAGQVTEAAIQALIAKLPQVK